MLRDAHLWHENTNEYGREMINKNDHNNNSRKFPALRQL